MALIEFVDANCMIGRGPEIREGAPKSIPEMYALMDDCYVSQAVVFHSVARYADILRGNQLLIDETRSETRLLPQWTVLPALWDLYPKEMEWIREMKKNNVISVRLFPAQYGHSLKRYACGRLLDVFGECRVPVFIHFDQLSSWDALWDLCQDYPDVRFVLCSPGYRCLRYLLPIMEQCENLYVETCNLLMHDGLKDLCNHGYAERLLFGSGFPDASMVASASQIALSDMSEEEKSKIASGNIRRLLSEVRL